jgi:predicted nucleic acid-binding protein
MIMVDSTILIEYFQKKDQRLLNLMKAHDGAICGIVRAEVLHGARDARHRARLLIGLNALNQISIPESLWDIVGDNLDASRSVGLTVPFSDMCIATIAMSLDIEVWTRDKHFSAIQTALPQLKLFQEPP